MTVQERVSANAKNANIKEAGQGFSKSMPAKFDSDSALLEGDKIYIPAAGEFKVYTQNFGKNARGEDVTAQFIVVKVINKDNVERSINFFPTSLTKNIWPAVKDANGTVETITAGGPKNPNGTAVDAYLAFQGKGTAEKTDMQLGMEALAGKVIEIAKKEMIDTQVYRNGERKNELKQVSLLTYNLVA